MAISSMIAIFLRKLISIKFNAVVLSEGSNRKNKKTKDEQLHLQVGYSNFRLMGWRLFDFIDDEPGYC